MAIALCSCGVVGCWRCRYIRLYARAPQSPRITNIQIILHSHSHTHAFAYCIWVLRELCNISVFVFCHDLVSWSSKLSRIHIICKGSVIDYDNITNDNHNSTDADESLMFIVIFCMIYAVFVCLIFSIYKLRMQRIHPYRISSPNFRIYWLKSGAYGLCWRLVYPQCFVKTNKWMRVNIKHSNEITNFMPIDHDVKVANAPHFITKEISTSSTCASGRGISAGQFTLPLRAHKRKVYASSPKTATQISSTCTFLGW